MFKSLTIIFPIAVLMVTLSNCKKESTIVYSTPLASQEFQTFMPGIVSTDSFEFNSLYSPDGQTFYFSKDKIYDIYQTTFDGKQWSAPVSASFCEKEYKECDPAFSPDGKRLYYISTRGSQGKKETFDIWFVERQGDDWSAPQNLEVVNSDSSEFYVSFADNGNLYFASNREGGYGSFDIYVSRFVNGDYTAPVNLGDSVNNDHFEHDPFISKDERLIIYTSVNREGGLGRGDLYYAIKDQTGRWSQAKNLGSPFNTADYDFCPYITPDGKYFFYSDNNDIRWIDAEVLKKKVGWP